MLPRKIKNVQGVALGLLVLCISCEIVAAVSDCLSCDNFKTCALRQNELRECKTGSCVTIYNNKGLIQKRGCSSELKEELTNYCAKNADRCIACESDNCYEYEPFKMSSKSEIKLTADAKHQCHHCTSSEDCEEGGGVVECSNTEDGALCYMKFAENIDVNGMGCMSDFNNEKEIIDLVKQKLLYICEGELCNGFEHIPQPNECSSCRSSDDENCALHPASITATINCNLIPYTHCYERVNNETNGITERGCSSNLDGDSLWECLSAKTGHCRLCTGNGCNIKVTPEIRPKCHRCDSSTTPTCENSPDSLSICPVYNKDESCVANYENGHTKRGCLSDFKCDAKSRNCQICKGDGCNTANLKRRAEEIYGIFQELPLNCNTCKGVECQTDFNMARKCEGDPFQDCLTVFNVTGKVVRRGCELAVLEDYSHHCDKHPELCFNCKSNGCNTMTDASKFQECLFCDAATNPDCLFKPETITNTRKCVEGCVASLYPRKTNTKIYDFVRTCFEDIESDDRENCNSKNNCVKCSGNKCNKEILPTKGRLSCMFCNGSDCNRPVSKQCSAHSIEDQCYIFFSDENYSAIKMGCKSELSEDKLENHSKQYFLCDGNNCNTFKNLSESNLCYTCDSGSNLNCSIDPTQITEVLRCQTYPFTECISWINEHNRTLRGCLYDTPNDIFNRCRKGDPSIHCRLCTESYCNKAIYPGNRRQCYRCNSKDDPKCESSPSVTQPCPLYQAKDACVTKLIDGITYRGCLSEFSCDGAKDKNCQICDKNNCNNIILANQSIGDPGIFQTLPLNCYHCKNKVDCDGNALGLIRKCEKNDLQTCTIAFDKNSNVVGRGCSDLFNVTCGEKDINCYDCKSNGCNTAEKKTDYIDCIHCNALEGENCTFEVDSITRRRKCHKSCMTALFPRTDDAAPVYELIRTCLDDMELDDREECEAGKNLNCKACNTTNCNTDNVGVHKSCYHCSGDDCQSPKAKTCRAVMDYEQCFIEYDENSAAVKMGCKSDYDPKDVQKLLYAARIWLCDDDNCNDIEHVPAAQSCIICNSRTDPACATQPDTVYSATNCNKQPYTNCYMRTLTDGHTERGCLSNIEGQDFVDCLSNVNSTACMTCIGSNCNKEIFPADRRLCHVCSSKSNSECETAPDNSQICLKYNANEHCVSSLDQDGNTLRGCSSEISCDFSDSSTCHSCGSNDCNVLNIKRKSDAKPGMWQNLPLSCHLCTGVKECKNQSQTTTCLRDNEYCMTVFNENGDVQKRGCSEGIESEFGAYCDVNSAKCHNCNSNNCNTATDLSDYSDCIYCDSERNTNCVLHPELIVNRRKCNTGCMTALYPKPNSSAYALTRSCLDDKDAADQESCRTNDEYCVACVNTDVLPLGCNKELLPKTRWSCNVCQDEECVEIEPQTCTNYKENDQCFMLFNKMSNVVRMGCVSDLIDSFLVDNSHLLHLCNDTKNCNRWEMLPKPQRCIECNSFDDPECASNPENIPALAMCAALPNTQCFTEIFTDGSTGRGCVSNLLESQQQLCLTGISKNCVICKGDACNNKIFPDDRRRCHRCNSKVDPNCQTDPTASDVCPFYSADEFCSTKLVNGHTYRGCSSDFQCDVTDYVNCRMCKGEDNCNTIDLISLDIGNPGKWQGLPLNCYICEGEECASGNGLVQKCQGNTLQTCGTVFDQSGKVVQRGCSGQIYAEDAAHAQHCLNNSEHCKFCKSNGCNTAKSLNDYVDCILCDSTENTDCVQNVTAIARHRKCHKKCMTGLYPRKDEVNPAYELSRGCLDDLDFDEREACENGDMAFCKACAGATCNTIALPERPRLKCNVCNDSNCSSPKSQECLAYREHDQCYALFDTNNTNKVIRMGCGSDLDNVNLLSDRRHLFLCDGDNCNIVSNFPKPNGCKHCDSVEDATCATMPNGLIVDAGCNDLPWTQCYTEIDKNGNTRRGCLSDVSDDVFDQCIKGEDGNCVICAENNCNNQVFPANRRSCHRCDSKADPTCVDNPQEFRSICPIYNSNDSCVVKTEGLRTLRGCTTDFTCDPSDSKKCRICNADNCNSVNLLGAYVGEPGKWQDLPLNCYHCEGKECENGIGIARKCEDNDLQTCMTVFNKNGKVEKRGCSDAVEKIHMKYCEENSDKCFTCKSNGCNTAKSLSDYTDCLFCDSNDDKGCSVNFNASNIRTRKCNGDCVVALYPRSRVEDTALELSRSCLDDLESSNQEKCRAGDLEYCKACTGARCNVMSVPAERHECYQCLDKECEDFESQQCNAYHPNDQCYILYDQNNSISLMGCRSEYEMNVVTDLIKQKRLILCDGKNCNKPEIVQTKVCLACDSAEDPRCATNPNLIVNNVRCASFPYTDCATFVNKDGHTLRNCVSELPSEEFYGCITNSDGLCQTCSTNNCNSIDIFPANRMRCQQCDSATNEKCASTPDRNLTCPIYDPNDACVTNLRNGITYRGCASSLKCYNEDDRRNCRTCTKPGCNTVDLVKISEDGEPGKWQDVPLNCRICSDEEDCKAGIKFKKCEENLYQNCMTVFNVAGKVIQRGCSDAVEASNKEWCNSNKDNCPRCNSNGCNEANSLDDYVECLACDTDTNGNCVNNIANVSKTRKCYKHCMTALYPRENEKNPAYHLTRSCLDDMDMDERDACAAGNMNNCKACDGAKCNTVALPEKRLSCQICKGENCQLPEIALCPTYREKDQCYILYDEQRSISALGCRSEFSNADADYYFRQKRLFLCTEDNCNDIDAVPAAQTCEICSSRTDVSCATNPSVLNINVTCNIPPFTECYTKWRPDGSTERGCLSSLYDDEFLECLSDNSTVCEVCKGNACNNKVFPEGRTACHICDSRSDLTCESNPHNVSICPKYNPDDVCVTAYRSGVTLRGCSSSLSCDGNKRVCSKCQGDGCNTINLAKRQDNNFGKWQDLPLRCYVCSGNECNNLKTNKVATCKNNNEQDCMVVFDKNNKVIARGCADQIEETYEAWCNTHENHCINCKSNECNNAVALNEFIDCVYCDTSKDLKCLWEPLANVENTRKCHGSCMTALYPADSSDNPSYELIRTCLDDKDAKDQGTCSKGRDTNCKACNDASCNIVDLPEDRLKCLYCVHGNCEEPMSMQCPLYKKEDQCYIWFNDENSVSEMGCLSSFRNQEIESVIRTKRIYVCNEGDNCNSLDRLNQTQKCTICDSNQNPLCAINAKSVSTFRECNVLPYTGCYSRINTDGSTVRGCQTDLSDDNFVKCVLGKDNLCEACNGDGCNREIFPADRQQCYKCTSLDDPECESFPSEMHPCALISDTESCKTALSGNETVRGCSSEIFCDVSDRFTCRACFGTECNSIDLRNKVDDYYHGAFQELPLSCHKCIGEHCKVSLGPVESCKNYDQQDCMTVFERDGTVRRRGCSDEVEDYEDLYCRKNPQLCFKCKSNECNVAWSLSDYVECAFCNSSRNADCVLNPESSTFENRKCYKECMVTMINNDEIIRSCLDDKEVFNQVDCHTEVANGKECASCTDGNCNTFVYPSDRLKCHICDSDDCRVATSHYCMKYDENDYCFAKYEKGLVERMGCASSQNKSDLNEWTAQRKIFRCQGSDCNDLEKLPTGNAQCVQCDSANNAACAQDPLTVGSYETCDAPSNECVTKIDESGNTKRGCFNKLDLAEQDKCLGAGTCAVCTSDRCNTGVHPADRRRCHICNSNEDASCAKSPNALAVCAKYVKNDRCVTNKINDLVQRGCASQISCNESDERNCKICDTDGCNTVELTSAAILLSGSILLSTILAYITLRGMGF